MVKLIAKIQISLGILLIIASVIGIVLSINQIQEKSNAIKEDLTRESKYIEDQGYSNETQAILNSEAANFYLNISFHYLNIYTNAIIGFSLIIIISLFFTLQGINNLKNEKK